jgi:hypothetical protein
MGPKNKINLLTVHSNTVLNAWQVAMHPIPAHYTQYMMATGLITLSTEQHYILLLLEKEKMEPA